VGLLEVRKGLGLVFGGMKMKKYIMNSAVITAEGLYRYRLITPEEAMDWYNKEELPYSTVGYKETADALECVLGVFVPLNRVTVKMEPGDEALVFRLVLPPGTPRIEPNDKGKLREVVLRGWWELGLLVRIE